MSDHTKVKNSLLKSKTKSSSVANDTAVDSLSNQKIKSKIKKKSSVAETRKGIILDKVSKDVKKTKLDKFLNSTIEVTNENFYEKSMEKMLKKIHKIKGLLNHAPNIINRDFAKTKKFYSTYSTKYEGLSNENKYQIREEIENNSNRRNEKYTELLTQVKKNLGLLSDIVYNNDIWIPVSFETPSQQKKDINENKFLSKLRSNSIIDEMMNDTILNKFVKSNTPISYYNTESKKKLSKNRSVIIDKGLKNINFLNKFQDNNSSCSSRNLKKNLNKLSLVSKEDKNINPPMIINTEFCSTTERDNNVNEIHNTSLQKLPEKKKDSISTSRNYKIENSKSESRIELRLTPKKTSYKSNNLEEKNKSSTTLRKKHTESSFHYHIPNSLRKLKLNRTAQKISSSSIGFDMIEVKSKKDLKLSFINARTELVSMRRKSTDNGKYYEEDLYFSRYKDEKNHLLMSSSGSKPSCNCKIF